MKKYEYHEVALIFPMMEGAAYEELKQDIQLNGQREPVVLYQGKIADGRNRAKVCRELGVELETKEWEEKDGPILGVVLSANLVRRHLKDHQRALIAANPVVYKHFEDEAKKRQIASGKEHGRGQDRLSSIDDNLSTSKPGKGLGKSRSSKPPESKPQRHRSRASRFAGENAKVSTASIDRARQVEKNGSDELKQAAYNGEVSLSNAAKLSEKLSKSEQTEVVKKGREAVLARVKKLGVKSRRKIKTPKLVEETIKNIETLIRRVKESDKGVSGLRDRLLKDLRLLRTAVKDSIGYLT